jgi:Icc protein
MISGSQQTARPFRLVQFSDCHVSGVSGARYRGIDPRTSFEQVLLSVLQWEPDLLVGTGDLSEDYSEDSYRYLLGSLEASGIPFLSLPGNHDLPDLQRRVLGDCPVDEPVVRDIADWRLVLLNSAVEGDIPGHLTDRMLAGLAEALQDTIRPKLVFLHHQPLPVGSLWIDRYPLREPERLWRLLDQREDVRVVTWGHIHQPFTAWRGHISLLGAPSTAANSLSGREKFTVDPRGPACRWFELSSNGHFETGLLGPGWEPSRAAAESRG